MGNFMGHTWTPRLPGNYLALARQVKIAAVHSGLAWRRNHPSRQLQRRHFGLGRDHLRVVRADGLAQRLEAP